jgi:rRNA processing protein Krr1/Pno1
VPPFKQLEQAFGGNLRIEGADDVIAVGDVASAAAARQVVVEIYKGIEAEAVLGDAQDEGMRLREFLTVAHGTSPFEGEFLGQGMEPVDGEFQGILAF